MQQNLKAGDLPASTTDVKFLDEAIEQANEAVNTATTAAQQAATAVKNANTAVSNANAAIADLNEQIASLDSNFATLARTVNISQLQTSAKNIVAAVNELNSKRKFYSISGIGETITFEMNVRSSYLVVCQHSNGTNYYAGIIAVDSNKIIKVIELKQTGVFDVSSVAESNKVEISSSLTYWYCCILTI